MNRILLVHQPTDGGVGRHVRDLTAEGLGARGFEVILCSPAAPQGTSQFIQHRPVDMKRSIAPRADLAAVRSLAAVIRHTRPALVHAHSSKAGALARLARIYNPRVPVVYSPHLYAFSGHFERSAELFAYRALERLLAPAASRVVCVCEAEAQLARSIGPASRVRVVHNGIAPAGHRQPDSRIAALAHRGPVIGAVTLLHPRKGLSTLLDAVPLILERHPQAQVAIVGDGPALESLREQARRLRIEHAVSFMGLTEDSLGAIAAVDIFAHPSWAEAFPYVILEAMSMGRAIVASDVGGTAEAILDGESGLLVPPRDKRALANALNELLDDPARRAKLGEQALTRVSERFTIAQMIDGLGDTYDELIPARSRTDR